MYTTSHALLDALAAAGVSHIFANFGSDHPALIEAIAERRAEGGPLPRIITCPHEMVGMSAAHGFYQASGVPQAVVVHVECGTQSLAGAVHNARKGRIPMLVFAGTSPATQEGELRGSRNEFIHWLQDVHDQRGLVRGYMKYDGEIRTGRHAGMLLRRALQIACSDPKGPAYLMSAREILEEEIPHPPRDSAAWPVVAPSALSRDDAVLVARTLATARRPLVVTSYLGRNVAAVGHLIRLCRRLAIGVLESAPSYVNYPHDDELYLGVQWNEQRQNAALAAADAILVLDSDVPWIPTVNRPARDARVLHIDVDPLKEQMPLWHVSAARSFQADTEMALAQIIDVLDQVEVDGAVVAERRADYTKTHEARRLALRALERPGPEDTVTAEHVLACLREHLDEATTIVNESVTHYSTVCNHLAVSRPGGMFASGGGSLGWNGGAALGIKLARPDDLVVAVTGDGAYMFSSPSTVHWMARRYAAPFLQVVLNNGGWLAPRFSTLSVHPDGYASRAASLDLSFDPAPDYAGIAEAAGGAAAFRIRKRSDVEPMLAAAVETVRRDRRAGVVDVLIGFSESDSADREAT